MGGPGYTIKDEFSSKLLHDGPGVLPWQTQALISAAASFSSRCATARGLTASIAVFGKVTKGMEVVYRIGKVATDANDKPLKDVVINKITIKQ